MAAAAGALRQLVLNVIDESESAQQEYTGKLADLLERIAPRFPLAGTQQVEALFPRAGSTTGDMSSWHRYIYLPALTEETCVIPVLTMRYDLSVEPGELRLRLALFHLGEANELEAVGFRFEMPEGGTSVHSFCHAQCITQLDKNNTQTELPTKGWTPTSQPAFALDAVDPVTLVVCLLFSLYGPEFVRRFVRGPFYDWIKASIDKMHSGEQLAT